MLYLAYTKARDEVIWLKSHHGHLKISLTVLLSSEKTQTIGRWHLSVFFFFTLNSWCHVKCLKYAHLRKKWLFGDLVNNNSIHVHMLRGQKQILDVLFYHCLPCSFEISFLTEPVARLAGTKQELLPLSRPLQCYGYSCM